MLKREIARKYGAKQAKDETIDSLFPSGVQQQATCIAGIPAPLPDAEIEQETQVKKAASKQPGRHYTDSFVFDGRNIKVYPGGNLADLEDRDYKLAKHLAKQEGIELTDERWRVIHYLRMFYFRYGITPMVKLLIDYMREELGSHIGSRDDLL